MAQRDRLGRLLSTHPVETGRYRRTGGTALAVGVLGGLSMAFLIAVPDLVIARLLAFALIATLVGLPIAAVQLLRAVRHGRSETFELYENGFARRTATDWRGWSWDEIAVLRTNPEAADTPAVTPLDGLIRTLGWNFRCSIRLADGLRIRIDGYAAEGPLIARELLAHRPDALSTKSARIPITLTVSPLAAVAFGIPLVLLYRHLNGTSSDEIGTSSLVTEAFAMIVCIVGLVMSLTVFVLMLVAVLRVGTEQDSGAENDRHPTDTPPGAEEAV
ncbi:hypothetical protein [Actinomadura opuntiae]|uniref:hypothetical protein n=1 Tax=Actinomadura sp. OS1-43 TaxID=604315 RepID=UPI00255A88BA|nr:hypothetical protein [Actinomadura sp. OS1-43]MDL4814262.1 hypothetical protein [Actinomadura sp. OS1-43]